jgi:spore coat protein U-like protein
MKKLILCLFIMAICLYFAGTAYAGTATSTLDVTVTAVEACTLVSTTGVNFPDYDSTVFVMATGDVTVNCPLGVDYNIAANAGINYVAVTRRLADGAGNFLEYSLTAQEGSVLVIWGDNDYDNSFPPAASVTDTGDGTDQPHIVEGTLLSGQSVPTGPYSDMVAVTVYW